MANIKVAVRVRPISEREINLTGSEIVVHTEPKTVSLTNLKVPSNKAGDSRERTRRYGFDFCFDSSDSTSESYASQKKIYDTLGETILDALFKRYNSCLVAYGQSASGKTYTMMGSKEDPGLTPRVCEGLFLRLADEGKSNGSFHVFVSYLEVYNERVRDLLRPSSNCVGLRVREHPRLGPYVQGLTHHAVPTLGSLISRVEEGTKARKTASTLQNPTSSRSHALLTLTLLPISDPPGQGATGSPTTSSSVSGRNDFPIGSKLHLVDLAGSESAAACGGINRLKEGANINKSLVALGNVISALADRGSARTCPGRRFIPYRDSALTWLLKDVLGGNATTVMLATISPASGSYNETSHTLRFAQRAQSVINRPVINEDPVSRIIRELRAEVARLKSLLLEKNVNSDVGSTSVCPYFGDPEASDEASETRPVGTDEKDEEHEKPIETDRFEPAQRRYSESPFLGKESSKTLKRFSSLDSYQELISSRDIDGCKYHEARISELFVNDEVDESAFVDIPTLVAVLIKPEDNNQAGSHQIEEIICSDIVDEGIEFQKNDDETLPLESSTAEVINSIKSKNLEPLKSKLEKQESIDSDLPSRKSTGLQSLKKYGSIESLARKPDIACPNERTNENLEKRNGSLGKTKRLNNIKEVTDSKSNKPLNSWKSLGICKDLQQRLSSDVDKKDSKFKIQPKRQNFDGLKRKASKDSSSSSSKDDLLPREKSSRKGSLEQESTPPRVHTPIQRASRAEIVAAVTERLFSRKKISEDINTATTTPTTASEGRSPESTDVKIAAATRMRLQEISRKMLAKRRKICVDTQTDNQQTIRVRDAASLTEEPKIVRKDASILTDCHEDLETLPSTSPVLRVKEISTFTETNLRPVIRCKNVATVTDEINEDYSTFGSPRNDSGIVSDEVITDSGSHVGTEMSDNSTNTGKQSGGSDSASQTQKEDHIDRCSYFESRCCGRSYHSTCQGRDRNLPRTENNVISISLPDMVNITIESSNALESKIRVFDGSESVDEKMPANLKDNETQTDKKDALERETSTDDIFGQISFHDFSLATKPMAGQNDGKPFRIENIFHETGNTNRTNPSIEIVNDMIGNEVGKNSLTVTSTVGTCFVPETRENATGMENTRRYSLTEHFGRSTGRRTMNNDGFGKNTWPGQWRNRVASTRRKFSPPWGTQNEQTLPGVPTISFDLENYGLVSDSLIRRAQSGFNAKNVVIDEAKSQNNATEVNERKPVGLKPSPMIAGMDSPRLEQDANFSDDSLDLTEEKIIDRKVIDWNSKKLAGEKSCKKTCPPDVVAHTKNDINESSIPSAIGLESDDFDDNQQIVFPKKKLDSNLPSYTTPISDFRSLILGDSCCGTVQDSEGSKLTSNDSCSTEDGEEIVCCYSDCSYEPKSIMKKSSHKRSEMPDQHRNVKNRDYSSGTKRVHFAVPEIVESISSDSEICEDFETDDETVDEGARNILEEYLDEAVVFMRTMNSMNEYMSATCGVEKYTINNRNRRRRGKVLGPNYIEFDGRRINLYDDDNLGDPNSDEDLDFDVESYEKCLKSMDRLEECLAKVKRHDEILRDNYGIQVNESNGAKLDLVKSDVDLKAPNELPNHKIKCKSIGITENQHGKVMEINGNADSQIGSLGDENIQKPGNHDDKVGIFRKSSNGSGRFVDLNDQKSDCKIEGRFRDSVIDDGKAEEGILESIVKLTKTEDSPNTSEMLRVPGCYLTLPRTKRIVMGLSEGIKSSCGRSRIYLCNYESSNEGSSSTDALESFMESIDNSTKSREKFKYPGSPRSKFLQLLNERRRIVENTRNTGVS